MLDWITENFGTILITAVLAGIVVCIIRSLVKERKQGKSPCGGSCGRCPMGGACREGGECPGADALPRATKRRAKPREQSHALFAKR